MKRISMIGALAAMFALVGGVDARAVQLSAATAGIEAVGDLRPAPGQTARALVRLSGRPGAEPRGVLIALRLPMVSSVKAALSPGRCGLRTTAYVWEVTNAVVAADGTAYRESDFNFGFRQLQRARSLALLADADGDGADEVLACGALAKVRAGASTGRRAPRLGTASRLSSAPRFLTTALIGSIYGGDGKVTLTGGDPDTEYRLGLSPRSCGAGTMAPVTPLARLRTDALGAGYSRYALKDVTSSSLRRARSVVIARPQGDRLIIVVCARFITFNF